MQTLGKQVTHNHLCIHDLGELFGEFFDVQACKLVKVLMIEWHCSSWVMTTANFEREAKINNVEFLLSFNIYFFSVHAQLL